MAVDRMVSGEYSIRKELVREKPRYLLFFGHTAHGKTQSLGGFDTAEEAMKLAEEHDWSTRQ